MWQYNQKVMEYFLNPRNVGEIDKPDAEGLEGSIVCGDALKLQLRVDKKGVITDAKFQTFGCASAIASASILTEMIVGKHIEEAARITNKDIVESLGGLPEEKIHCSVMGMEALQAAIGNYYERRGEKPPFLQDTSRVVCQCFGVTENKIRRVIEENDLRTVDQVTYYTKAGGGCGKCQDEIRSIINDVWKQREKKPEPIEKPKRLTNIQKINLIQETIEREIRPTLQKDGGDVELIDVEGNKVEVAFRGMCRECPVSGYTLKNFVEAKLREFVVPEITVEEIK